MTIYSDVKKQDYGAEYSIGVTIGDELYILENTDIYEFYIIEDLYSYVLTGSLKFLDRQNLFEFSNITGDIQVMLWFGVDNETNITLHLHRSTRISPSGPNEQGSNNILEFSLVAFNFRYLVSQKFSYSWSNAKITDIVSDILTNMVGFYSESVNIKEISDEKIDFVMPYWTPFQALNWLLLRASSENKWGYCCYTKTEIDSKSNGIVTIQTIESMLQQTTLCDDVNGGVYKLNSSDPYDFGRILSYDISGIDLASTKQLRGSHILGYDFNRKKLIDEKFQYSSGENGFNEDSGTAVIDNFTMLGDWTLMKGTEYSYLNDTDVDLKFSGEKDENIIKNIYFNDWIKRYCVQNTINIIVRGHETRKIGELIWLKWPSSVKDEVYNINLDGLYLIKNITHSFDPKGKPQYRQKLGLIKNAYNYNTLSPEYSFPSVKRNETTLSNLME